MINNNVSITSMLNAIIPITRFNRGEANKIFNEVSNNGFKIVMKNNKPACILLTPERYEKIMEALEDYQLFLEAEKRMKNAETKGFISTEDMYKELGINDTDLENVEVEIE